MTRRAPILALLAASIAVGVACSGGGGGGSSARVSGLVVDDDTGFPIDGASVTVGGASATSGNDGRFVVGAAPGEHTLAASAADYHPIDTRVLVASGDNDLKLRLVPCDPFGDAACPPPATPTPTETPLPTPANANVAAAFDGVNPVLDGSAVPDWMGQAIVVGDFFGTRFLGDDDDLSDFAYSECWLDANGNFPAGAGDARADLDHCYVFWFGPGKGVTGAGPDALVALYVPGPAWVDATILQIGVGGVDLDYYEGSVSGQYGFTFNLSRNASEGVMRLERAGYYAPQPVTLSTGAFVVPNLP